MSYVKHGSLRIIYKEGNKEQKKKKKERGVIFADHKKWADWRRVHVDHKSFCESGARKITKTSFPRTGIGVPIWAVPIHIL